MGRKTHKVDAPQSGDIVIDLLVRHADVPEGTELLERYSRTYSGRPAGFVPPVETVAEPEPVVQESLPEVPVAPEGELEVPPAEYSALEEVIAAAGDDTENDYDSPGATVAMEAVDVPAETMTFDAAEIAAMADDEPAAPVLEPAVEAPSAEAPALADVPAVDDSSDEDFEGGDDENATVMMGAVELSGASGQDDASGRKKKKRRHR